MEVQVNWIGVLIAAVASMVVGFLWYGPMLFGKMWARLRGFSAESMKKQQSEMGKWYGLSFVLALITAYVLSHVMALSMNFFHYDSVTTGLMSAFWMWLGFVMPVQATATIFSEKRNWQLLGIDTGYQLVAMLVMGLVLGML